MNLKIEKTTTKKLLDELNSYEYNFRCMNGKELSPLEFEECNKEGNINIYEIKFIKEAYNEFSDESLEIYWISKNKKEIIDYIARKYITNNFGDRTYYDFYKVERRDIKVTIWEIEGDKFYEE